VKAVTQRRGICVLVVALMTAALGGCGGDESSSDGDITVETGSLAKPQFVKRADEICQDINDQARGKVEKYLRVGDVNPASESKLARTILIPAFEEEIDQISSLGAPAGDEEQITAILTSIQTPLDQAKSEPTKFLRGGEPFPAATKLAEAYGLKSCPM
jgi:hypothetical protein